MPFDGSGGDDSQMRFIRQGKYIMNSRRWGTVSSQAKDFIRSLLEVEGKKRLSAHKALRHKWILKHSTVDVPEQLHQAVKDSLCSWKAAPKFQRAMMGVMAASLGQEQHGKIREYFLAMDRDNDGLITISEIKADFKADEEVDVETASASSTSTVLDLDIWCQKPEFGIFSENYQTQDLSYSEFLAAMMSSYIPITEDMMTACFKKFDTRDTGKIFTEDVQEVLGDSFEDERVEDLIGAACIDYEEFAYRLCPDRSSGVDTSRMAKSVRSSVSSVATAGLHPQHVSQVSTKCSGCSVM